MLLTYQQTIQGAFRDVSNGLIAYHKNREFRIQEEHLLESAQDAARLSEVRFKAGTTDYLEVLTNETNSFSAELGVAQACAQRRGHEGVVFPSGRLKGIGDRLCFFELLCAFSSCLLRALHLEVGVPLLSTGGLRFPMRPIESLRRSA
jgi:hypothetical protein